MTTIKYVFIALKADNHGEGGIFSLYALVKNYGKLLILPAMLGEGQWKVILITLTIISLLFSIQHAGTSKIGKSFGPVMLI